MKKCLRLLCHWAMPSRRSERSRKRIGFIRRGIEKESNQAGAVGLHVIESPDKSLEDIKAWEEVETMREELWRLGMCYYYLGWMTWMTWKSLRGRQWNDLRDQQSLLDYSRADRITVSNQVNCLHNWRDRLVVKTLNIFVSQML